MSARVKICGVRRVCDARTAIEAGAHAAGINCVPESPRYIGGIAAAQQLVRETAAPDDFLWVGVFVNPTREQVAAALQALPLQVVQLHGEESPEFLQRLKFDAPGIAIWKAFRIAQAADLPRFGVYACDAWVLDAKAPGQRGGAGKTFDWSLLSGLDRRTPLVLSGGLNCANVAEAVRAVVPNWVDVASGVESAPGIKDAALVRAFVKRAVSFHE
jgi:phosphoribosylanthranilate isomerase